MKGFTQKDESFKHLNVCRLCFEKDSYSISAGCIISKSWNPLHIVEDIRKLKTGKVAE